MCCRRETDVRETEDRGVVWLCWCGQEVVRQYLATCDPYRFAGRRYMSIWVQHITVVTSVDVI